MISSENMNQIVHQMLVILNRSKTPTHKMFYETYRALFSPVKVPALRRINPEKGGLSIVEIDCKVAINYLKDKYQFYTRSELEHILKTENPFSDVQT